MTGWRRGRDLLLAAAAPGVAGAAAVGLGAAAVDLVVLGAQRGIRILVLVARRRHVAVLSAFVG